MKRWLRILLAIPLLLILCVAFVLFTQSGLRLAASQVHYWAPDLLKIEKIEGNLTGRLRLQGLAFQNAQQKVKLESLTLHWHPVALLSGAVEIEQLHLTGVRYEVLQAHPTAEPSGEPLILPDNISLPVTVSAKDIQLKNIDLVLAPDGPVQHIESVTLNTTYSNEFEAALNVSVISDLLNLNGEITAQLEGDYTLDGALNWELSLPSYSPMIGATTVTGSLQELTIDQSIASPYGIAAKATLSNPIDNLVADLSIALTTTDLKKISADLPPYKLDATLGFIGSAANGTAQSMLTVTDVIEEDITASLNASIVGDKITLDDLNIQLEESPVILAVSGSVDSISTEPQVDLNAQWQNITWPLQGEPVITSSMGVLHVNGTLNKLLTTIDTQVGPEGKLAGSIALQNTDTVDAKLDWRKVQWPMNDAPQAREIAGTLALAGRIDQFDVSLAAEADTDQADLIKLSLSGTGTDKAFIAPLMRIDALGGKLSGAANIDWASGLSFAATASGSNFDPSTIFPEHTGQLDLNLAVSGTTIKDVLDVQIHNLSVDGTLKDNPLTLQMVGNSQGSSLQIDKAVLESGPTRVQALGEIGDTLNLTWSVDSPDLAALLPGATGSIEGLGKVSGTLSEPVVLATLSARELSYPGFSLATLDFNANIDTAPDGVLNTQLDVQNGKLNEIELHRIALDGSGFMNEHTLSLAAKTNQGNADLTLDGAYADKSWQFNLNETTLAYPELAPWILSSPAKGFISTEKNSLNGACFKSGKSSLCIDLEAALEDLSVKYDLTAFPISYFKKLLPDTVDIKGIIQSSGAITRKGVDAPIADITLDLRDARVNAFNEDDEPVRVLTLQPSSIKLLADEKGAMLDGTIDLGKQGRVDLDAKIVGDVSSLADGELSGQINGNINNIGFLQNLVPEIEAISGEITTDLTVSGTIKKPNLSGGLALGKGSVQLATPGLSISNFTASVTAQEENRLALKLKATSGDGDININGVAAVLDEQPSIYLSITGSDFQVINTAEALATVSPDLKLAVEGDAVKINGRISIPMAEITPRELPPGVVQVSPDQIIVGEEQQTTTASPLNVAGNITLSLGDSVSVEAFGLKARLTGDITATESPGKETTARGGLDIIDGTFKAYGQNLQIQKGKILFAGGPISQPGFDLEAIRNVTSELQVGVRARGAIQKPEFSLFSDPPMAESEQLSYLVLGRPLQDSSPAENSAVRQAAMALGVAGGEFLTEKFGGKLGLDQVKIDSELRETGEQASLVVGKYLSPKLFVSYGVGLFEPVSTLRLNYTLTQSLKLVTETTESKSGGDIVFTFERGK